MVRRELARLWSRVREEPRPLRFLASRVLWSSGLGQALGLRIRTPHGTLRFSNSAAAANLWMDPRARETQETLHILHRALRPGDVFVDVGANIGVLTLAAARVVGAAGRVVALEPHPRTFGALARNVRANGLDNVTLECVGADERGGTARMTDLRSDDQNRLERHAGGIRVPVAPLDDVCRGMARVRLLNIDVEGEERTVLAGATATLARTEVVTVEAGPSTGEWVRRCLEEHGFLPPVLVRQGAVRFDLLAARDEALLRDLVDSARSADVG